VEGSFTVAEGGVEGWEVGVSVGMEGNGESLALLE
jgi:hypothetical protein